MTAAVRSLSPREGDALRVPMFRLKFRWPRHGGGPILLRRSRSLGDQGERLAERYLRRQGMKIVGRQVRVGGGELDLVAVEGRTVVFVEVKTRRSAETGHPLEAVTRAKQGRIVRAALFYLRRHHLLECAVRFANRFLQS